MILLRIFGFFLIAIITILLVVIDDSNIKWLTFLAIANIVIAFFTKDLWDSALDIKKRINKRREFNKNKLICINGVGKYIEFFKDLSLSEHSQVDLISIIETIVKNIYSEKYPKEPIKQNAVRASVYYEISLNTKDPKIKQETFDYAAKIISQYNFRTLNSSTKVFLNALAIERGTIGKRWKIRTLNVIREIIPTVDLFILQEELKQLTRFKEFLKEKFSEKFTAENIAKSALSKGEQYCYWIIGKNLNDRTKSYLKSFPIFSVKPGKSHNFPGLDPVIFTHYLVRIEDSKIRQTKDLIMKLKSLSDKDSDLLLFALPINSTFTGIIESPLKSGSNSFFRQEAAKKTFQYFISGIVDLPISNNNFESAINSGFLSIEEIIQVIPLSFLIKKVPGIRPEFFDQIGNQLVELFDIQSITDWKDVKPPDLFKAIQEIEKHDELNDYIDSFSEQRLTNICIGIQKNATELNKHLNL